MNVVPFRAHRTPPNIRVRTDLPVSHTVIFTRVSMPTHLSERRGEQEGADDGEGHCLTLILMGDLEFPTGRILD